MYYFLALFLLLFLPLEADESFDITSLGEGTSNYMSEFVNMLITLLFVVILIFITVWFLKKMLRSRIKTLNRSNGIKILERRPLNPKSSLYLVDILGKGVVVSESPAGIHVITEFPEGVNIEELLEQLQEHEKPSAGWKESLVNKFRKGVAKNHAG